MSKARTAVLRSAAAMLLALAFAAGCSSTEDAAGDNPGGAPTESSTTTTTTVPPLTTQPRQSCWADSLGAASAAAFPAPELVDVLCETEYAVATLANGPDGEVALFFALQDGTWVLVGNAPVDDAERAVPSPFSPTAVAAWQRLRYTRLTRPQGASNGNGGDGSQGPPSSLDTDSNTGESVICTDLDADYQACAPPTTAPVVTEPEDPNAPPTTVKQSGFCKYNYNDPRCVADPGFKP